MIRLNLPYPPSVNHIWRRVKNKTVLSAEARRYRKSVTDTVMLAKQTGGALAVSTTGWYLPLTGRVAISITFVPPDRRRRDLDNCLKAVLDALTHAGVWRDDELVDRLEVVRADPCPAAPMLAAVITVLEPKKPGADYTFGVVEQASEALTGALAEVAIDMDETISLKRLVKWLSAHEGKVVDGLCVFSGKDRYSKMRLWAVRSVGDAV